MSEEAEYFQFDGDQYPFEVIKGDRHSPPAVDEGYAASLQSQKRPGKIFLPRQGSVDYSRFEQILKNTKKYDTISNLPYHLREEVKDELDIEKESRTDWRFVASHMGVKSSIIAKIEREFKDNPTEKLLKEISNQKVSKFLQVLYRLDRHDVLNIFFDSLCIKSDDETRQKRTDFQEKSSKFPSQESTPVSGSSMSGDFPSTPPITPLSTPRTPKKDSGTPDSADHSDSGVGSNRSQPPLRAKTESFAKQNTDDDLRSRSSKSLVNFHSNESLQFWQGIPPQPSSTTKEWKEVEEAFKKDFKKESMQSQVMRFICYVLKIEPYEERHNKFVHDRDFANLVAWFGPVKSGKDGLFAKIAEMIKNSVTYKGNTGPHSFFAGYMPKDEADAVIGATEKVGTFLIRFSSTYAVEGSFVVVLKTHNGPEHILLQGNPDTGKISYKDKDYDDLISVYRRGLSRGGVSSDERISCTTICPNLPLNAMFKPYGPAPKPHPACGRGRGRGRGQEQ